MADTRYLKQRRQGWYFQIAVPRDLRERYGKSIIQVSLKTRDLSIAQQKRWGYQRDYTETFERLRNKIPLTHVEIEEEAQRVFQETLNDAAQAAENGSPLYWAENHLITDWGEEVEEDSEVAGLDIAAGIYADAIEEENYSSVAGEVVRIADRLGVEITTGTDTYKELAQALLKARIYALIGRREALLDKTYTPPPTFSSKAVDPVTLQPIARKTKRKASSNTEALPFSEMAESFLSEVMHDEDAKLREQTKNQHEVAFRLFNSFSNNASIDMVSREDASKFLDLVSTFSPMWGRSPETKSLSFEAVLERYGNHPKGLSNKTTNRYANSLSAVWKWTKKRRGYSGENPFSDQARRVTKSRKSGWLPFNDQELIALFQAPIFTDISREDRLRPTKHSMKTVTQWVPLIALYSGMRSGEICQLCIDDIGQENDIRYFDIHETENNQTVKTDAGIRRVPIHSELIKCGLLEYVEHVRDNPTGHLFPSLKPGGPDDKLNWTFTQRFPDFRRSLGIERDRVAFHSFRKNVGTALERARVPESEAVQVLGHEKLSMSYTVYSLGLTIVELKEIVEKISYPSLDLSGLH